MPAPDSLPAEAQLAVSSSSRVTPQQPPTAMHGDGGEEGPEEFKEFTDHDLQSKITRLRALRSLTPDGGQKSQRMVYRLEKELARRRAAVPRKVSRIWVLSNRFDGSCAGHCVFCPFLHAKIIPSSPQKMEDYL
jgi:hypothetical protein